MLLVGFGLSILPLADGLSMSFDSKSVLYDAPFGPVLISEGHADAPHVTTNHQLSIDYLKPEGAGFTLLENFRDSIGLSSYGYSDWHVAVTL